MADFPLIVGLDVDQSYGEFQNGISALVGRLNAKPPKIKIEINKKDAESQLSSLRKEIDALGKAGGGSSFASSLTAQLNTVSTSIQGIAKQLAEIGKASGGAIASGFEHALPLISELKTEIASLQSAMKGFSGINIDLGLSKSSGNAFQRTAAYGQSARSTIAELKSQAHQMETVFQEYYKASSGIESVMKALRNTSALNGKDIFSILNGVNNPKASLSAQMSAWRDYIALMKEVANIRGIDLSTVISGFTKGADEMVAGTQKVLTGEQQLEAGMERIKSLFGSGVDAEALSEQFNAVNTSIQSVVEAINNLKPDANVFQQLTESITNVTTAINGLVAALGNVDTSSVSKVGAQVAALKQGASAKVDVSFAKDLKNMTADLQTYSAKYDEVQRKFNNIKAPSAELSASYERLTQLMNTMRSTDASDQEKVAAYRQWSTALKEVNALLTSVGNAERDANKQATAQAKEAAEAERERAKAAKEAAAAEKEAAKKNRVIDPGTKEYLDNLSKIERKIAEVRQNEAKWTAARTGRTSGNYKEYVSQAAALEQLAADMRNGGLAAEEFKRRMAGIENSMTSNAAAIRGAGEATASLSDKFKGLISRVSSYFTAYQAVMYLWRGFKQAVSASIELEDAFAQLEIVTGATESEMSQFKDTAVSLATDLGKSVSDVTKSIETFSRLGYNLGDASTLAEYATILSNVAAVDTDSATTGLTSIIKGFDMDVANAGHVADVLVEVGQKYAVSAGEMMEAYERSGAALNATNTSFEKSAGLIAAANAAVQDSSVVGTALKTVSARIRGSKADLDELGESTEDLAEGFSKYAAEIKALTGFDIMLDEHTFKDLYDIMEGVAQVWDRLSDTQQARVSEILGGTRQLQVISSILGNWKDAAGAYETALNSVGAATRANDIYMDTATAHINQFKAAFQATASTLIDSSLIKGVVDFGTALLNIVGSISKVVDALGGLRTILAGFVVLNLGKIIEQISVTIQALTMLAELNIAKIASGFSSVLSLFSGIGAGFNAAGLKGAFVVLSDAIGVLGASLTAVGAGALVIIPIIVALVKHFQQLHPSLEELKEDLAELEQKEASAKEQSEALSDRIKELQALKNAGTITITEEAELDKLIRENQLLEQQIALYKDLTEQKRGELSARARQGAEQFLNTPRTYDIAGDMGAGTYKNTSGLGGLENAIDEYKSARDKFDKASAAGLTHDADTYHKLMTDAEAKVLSMYDTILDMRSNLDPSADADIIEQLDAVLDKISATVFTGVEALPESLREAYAEYQKLVDAGKNPIGTQAYKALEQEAAAVGLTVEEVIKRMQDASAAADELGGKVSTVFTEDVISGFGEVESRIDSLKSAFDSLSDGTMGVEDVVGLLEQFPELASYVDLTEDGFGRLDQGLRKLINDAPNDLIDTLMKFKETHDLTAAQTKQIDSMIDSLNNLPKDAVGALSEQFGVLADNIRNANEAQTDLQKALEEDDYDAGYDARVKNFEEFQKVLEAGEVGSKAFSAYKEYFGLMEKSTEDIQSWADANAKYFTEGSDGIALWLDEVERLTKDGTLQGAASYDSESGLFTYDVTRLDEFASALGWTEEMLQDFIYKYRMYVENWEDYSGVDLKNMFTDAGLIGSAGEGAVASMAKLMEYTGKSKEEVQGLIDKINQDLPDSWLKVVDDSFLRTFSEQGFGSGLEDIKTDMMNLKSVVQGLGLDWNALVVDGFSGFDDVLKPMLEALGWAEEDIDALRAQLVSPFEAAFRTVGTDSIDDVIAKLHAYNIDVTMNDDGALVVTQGLVDSLQEATGNAQTTLGIIDQLASRDDVEIEAGITLQDQDLNALLNADETATVNVVVNVDDEQVIYAVTTTAAAMQEILGPASTITLDANTEDANGQIALLDQLLAGLPNTEAPAVVAVNGETSDAVTSLQDVIDRLAKIKSKSITITTTYNEIKKKHAKGTKHASRGPALLGDEYSPTGEPKPELVVSKDSAYVAGVNGPVVSNLNEGDVVYTADETKKILGGNKNIRTIPAFAGGVNNKFRKGSSGTTVSTYQGSTGTASSTTNISVSTNVKEVSDELEEQLKELQDKINEILERYDFKIFMAEKHNASSKEIIEIYRKMQEEVHKQADKYRSMGVEEESEYIRELQKKWWEYEESIREARKKEFDEWLKDSQFAINVLEHDDASTDRIIGSWRTILKSINDEIDYYTQRGYDITSDEIQDLLKEAWDAEEQIEDILDSVLDKVTEQIDHIQDVFKTFQSAADEWNESNYLTIDTLQEIVDLGVEYMSCLQDENGQLVINKEAIAKMLQVKAQQLAVEAGLNYVRRIGNALMAGETEQLNNLLYATVDTTGATWDLVYANLAFLGLTSDQYKAAYTNLDKIRSVADGVSENIRKSLDAESKSSDSASDSLEDAKEGLEKIIGYTEDLIKHEHDEMVDALDDQLDKYKKIVEEKKKSLDLTKSELSYNKDIENRVKEIAKLQAQADVLALDDSREAQIKRAKILEEIAEKQEDLEEKQRDHSIQAQKDALDKQEEDYENSIKKQKEAIEEEISSEEKLHQLALDRIENSDWDQLKTDLLNWNTEYGTSLNDEITSAWNDAIRAVEEYGSVVEALKHVGEKVTPEEEEEKEPPTVVSKSYNHPDNNFGAKADQMKENSLKWLASTTQEEKNYYAGLNEELAKEFTSLGLKKDSQGRWIRNDGTVAYELTTREKEDYVKDIMKANSAAWWLASDEERKRLAEKNNIIAKNVGTITKNEAGVWIRSDGTPLYTFSNDEKAAIARQIVSAMKANSNAWSSASESERKRLADDNVRMANSVASLLGAKVTRDANGVWYINGEKLYEKYHSGGVVGGGTIKDRERFALLNKGEMVLSDTQKQSLEHLLAVGQMLRDKSSLLADSVFGGMVNNIAANSMKGIRNQLPGEINKPTQVVQVDASLTVSGAVDDDVLRVIKKHPSFVAEQVAKVLL